MQKSQTYSLISPVKGWNTRDPLAAMRDGYASILDNFVPREVGVELRSGIQNWLTGLPASPVCLMSWNGPANSKMFAATNTGIFDATSSGVAGAAEVVCQNGKFSYANFTTSGGHYLIAVNNRDDLLLYDGSSWNSLNASSTPAITGAQTDELTSVAVAKRRLWFTKRESSSAYYLPTAAVAGSLTEFPLGQVFGRGGTLRQIASWTVDGGNGPDDYTVFVSSEGELAVYSGNDPSDSGSWALAGVYYVGEPLPGECLTRFGSDLLYLCQRGLFPLSKILRGSAALQSAALSDAIAPTLLEAASLYRSNRNWQVTLYPKESVLLVNIPVSGSSSVQYVMNTLTGAWTRFTGWPAASMLVFGQNLYIATGSRVAKAWVGVADYTQPIVGKCLSAYSSLGAKTRRKHIKLLRPSLSLEAPVDVRLAVAADYRRTPPLSFLATSAEDQARWDEAVWGSSSWAGLMTPNASWATVFSDPCYAAALYLQISSGTAKVQWTSTDFVYQVGGVL